MPNQHTRELFAAPVPGEPHNDWPGRALKNGRWALKSTAGPPNGGYPPT